MAGKRDRLDFVHRRTPTNRLLDVQLQAGYLNVIGRGSAKRGQVLQRRLDLGRTGVVRNRGRLERTRQVLAVGDDQRDVRIGQALLEIHLPSARGDQADVDVGAGNRRQTAQGRFDVTGARVVVNVPGLRAVVLQAEGAAGGPCGQLDHLLLVRPVTTFNGLLHRHGLERERERATAHLQR